MRAVYTAAAVYMKPLIRLNNQWDSHNFICSMIKKLNNKSTLVFLIWDTSQFVTQFNF